MTYILALFGIFATLIVALIILSLSKKISKFDVILKCCEGKKRKMRLLSVAISAVLFALLVIFMNVINAVVCILHLLVIWIICDGINIIIQKCRKKLFKRYYSGVLALALTFCYLSAGWYLAHNVTSTNYTLNTGKDVTPLRVIQFSDAHIGVTFDGEGFSKHIEKIQSESPDIVLITGDFVDDNTSADDILSACNALGKLNTTYGVYFSFGNHDKGYFDAKTRGWDSQDLTTALKENGVVILEDEVITIGENYYLIGRQDLSVDRGDKPRATMKELTNNLDKDKYMIVMDHQPHDYEAQAESGVDLVLSGHTHGGQMMPITYVGEWMGINCLTYGHVKQDKTDFIVTSGIGSWELKFKTGCKSEYVVIDIENSD